MEVSPAEIQARINAGEALRLIDVREVSEHRICRIEGATLIPDAFYPAAFAGLGR